MGYTATGTYNDAELSVTDKAKIDSLKSQYESAKAGGATQDQLDAIHQQAENIRSGYGYSGGADGSEYNALEKPASTTASYSGADLYSGSSANDYIQTLYQAQLDSALQALKTAYDKNTIALDSAESTVGNAYQSSRNQSAADALIAQQNMNEYFAGNGLNTGAAGQMQLSTGNQAQANQAAIDVAEANARKELATERLQLETEYQNSITQAIMDGKTEEANALYQEYLRLDNALIENSYKQATLDYQYAALAQDQSQFDDTLAATYAKYAADSTGSGTASADGTAKSSKEKFLEDVSANRSNGGDDDSMLQQWKSYGFNSYEEAKGYLGVADATPAQTPSGKQISDTLYQYLLATASNLQGDPASRKANLATLIEPYLGTITDAQYGALKSAASVA